MVPFALHIIKAELPYFLKTDASLDPLYELLTFCRAEIANMKINQARLSSVASSKPEFVDRLTYFPAPSTSYLTNPSSLSISDTFVGSVSETIQTWSNRENRIIFTIATRLVQEKEFPLAILLLEEMIKKFPRDPQLQSALGRIHLEMGNVKAATQAFLNAATLVHDPEHHALVHMNRGYIALAVDQYTIAIDHFQAALDLDPNNIIAANNRAICLLYTCDLTRAISSLEELIRKDPEKNLDETLVYNLCTLYDLNSEGSAEKKKSIMSLASKFASDSFDFYVLKLGQQ